MSRSGRELRSMLARDGALRLWLEETSVPEPAADEVVVRVEAAPINPADIMVLLASANPSSLRRGGTVAAPMLEGIVVDVPPALAGRLDIPVPAGTEGAGTVVAAGAASARLIGRKVAFRSTLGTYAEYRVERAADCLVLPDGIPARAAASAFINPLTALGMVETMRREGHGALVHTAAASSVGQMLNRVCLADAIPLVNIVRSDAQSRLLLDAGARYVLDSSDARFGERLVAALDETGATLAFDAVGGGTLASTLLESMERVATAKMGAFGRYGSPVHKQLYCYGVLDAGPKIIDGNLGMAWGLGGWLMTWFYRRLPAGDVERLRARVARELTTTFRTLYAEEIGLADLLVPEIVRAFSRRATGQKFLVVPHGAAAAGP